MSFEQEQPYVVRYINGSLKVVIPSADKNIEITFMEGKNIERTTKPKPEPKSESNS